MIFLNTGGLGSISDKDLAEELIEDLGDWHDVSLESEAKKAIQLDAGMRKVMMVKETCLWMLILQRISRCPNKTIFSK